MTEHRVPNNIHWNLPRHELTLPLMYCKGLQIWMSVSSWSKYPKIDSRIREIKEFLKGRKIYAQYSANDGHETKLQNIRNNSLQVLITGNGNTQAAVRNNG